MPETTYSKNCCFHQTCHWTTCRGYHHPICVPSAWAQKTTMRCLGHFLDDDGGISSCFHGSVRAMWRSFFGNLSSGLLASHPNTKLRFLNSCISAIPSFRWACWPYQDTYAATLDSVQRHMIAVLMQVRPRSEASFEAFAQRRHIYCGKIASKHGRWSRQWARSICSWKDHVDRRHDPGSWSSPVLEWHGTDWITQRRLLASSGLESRTGTRASRGKVHQRWEESLSKAAFVANLGQ